MDDDRRDRVDPADVVVVGAGPAAWSVAGHLARGGVDVALVAPDPTRPWPASYGAWADELPADLPADVRATDMADAVAIARSRHHLGRTYTMLSTDRLQAHLTDPAVRTVVGTARGTRHGPTHTAVVLGDGRTVPGRVIIDASGADRVLTGGRTPAPRAAQTAYGLLVDGARAAEAEQAFMDWRDDHGHTGWPTFLYAVPLDGGRLLLEETSLARRPGLPIADLRTRLHDRMAARGLDLAVLADAEAAGAVERVAFVVDTPLTRGRARVVPFGAAAPMIHPATGYSLAATLRTAPRLAEAILAHLPRDGRDAAAAARRAIWPANARLVHHLRRRGLEVLLALPPEGVIDFFELFFDLPAAHQRAYLSERDDARAVMAAMAAVFVAADGPLKRHLLRWGGFPIGDAPAPDAASRASGGTIVGHE